MRHRGFCACVVIHLFGKTQHINNVTSNSGYCTDESKEQGNRIEMEDAYVERGADILAEN